MTVAIAMHPALAALIVVCVAYVAWCRKGWRR